MSESFVSIVLLALVVLVPVGLVVGLILAVVAFPFLLPILVPLFLVWMFCLLVRPPKPRHGST